MERNYPANSHRSKMEKPATEEKRVKKVIKGHTRPKTGIQKFADTFINEDAANVKSYIFGEVIVPTICQTIVDIVTDSVNMVFGTGKRRGGSSRSSSRVSYRSFYDERDRRDRYSDRDRDRDRGRSGRFDYDRIEFDTRADAEEVREMMLDIIDEYGMVTVLDFYDIADQTAPYTADKFGWTSLRTAEPVRVSGGGYILKLPKAMPID